MLTVVGDAALINEQISNTTGMVAEAEGRRWLAFELSREYVAASALRFVPKGLPISRLKDIYATILRSETVSIEEEIGFQRQLLAV